MGIVIDPRAPGSDSDALADGRAALDAFVNDAPMFTRFRDGVETALYARVPDDWLIGSADVAGSTEAIANGAYKVVNMTGAAVIAALMNALGTRSFPFVFGGDGATFIVPPQLEAPAHDALAAMRRWTTDETDLQLRAGLIPVADACAAGHDVRLARYAPSGHATYALFDGGGIAWAEQAMKSGRYEVKRAPEGTRPDLEGLSCRWHPARSSLGAIVSLIVVPREAGSPEKFQKLENAVLQLLRDNDPTQGHPLMHRRLRFALAGKAYNLEVRTAVERTSRAWRRLKLAVFAAFAWTLFRFNISAGAFDPRQYREDLQANADFRKFDDGMKLTVDCTPETIARLEALLDAATADGTAAYGLHRQDSALITCIVPSSTTRDHIHFVDGADGGYARAAERLKKKI